MVKSADNSRVAQEALNQLVAAALAIMERLPEDFAYRAELALNVESLMDEITVPVGFLDAAVHAHGVELDRVLRRRPELL